MNKLSQAFSWWCYTNRGIEPETLLARAAAIGFVGVDLIDEELWPLVQKHGLRIAAIRGHNTFGLNRRENAVAVEAELRESIAKAEKWGISHVICFSGNREGQDDDTGKNICAETLSRVAPIAENAGVTLTLEMLNSKVDHVDYQADRTSFGIDVCEAVNSPAMKLLYDIYHLQVMEGDIIRTIQEHHRWFAHYHTAGNPGRSQPDETQEIYYPAIYRAIAATGYEGMISHEFVPKGDPLEALEKAYRDCAQALAS